MSNTDKLLAELSKQKDAAYDAISHLDLENGEWDAAEALLIKEFDAKKLAILEGWTETPEYAAFQKQQAANKAARFNA